MLERVCRRWQVEETVTPPDSDLDDYRFAVDTRDNLHKTMKNIVLVVPNFRWIESNENWLWDYTPYNLCLLSATIQYIANVTILDAYNLDLSQLEFINRLKSLNPDMVGITVLMDRYGPTGHTVARMVKAISKEIKVIMGGVYATVNASEVIKDENIDIVVAGEGEEVLASIVSGHIANGIWRAPRIKDLDSLPSPAYDLIDMSRYMYSVSRKNIDTPKRLPYARIMTSRGCPCACAFCQVETISGKPFRARSAKDVLAEIKYMKAVYGIKSILFDDDNLLHDKKRATEIFQGMVGMGLAWSSIATAVFKMDKDMIKLMKASGCEYVDIAIESACERILKGIIGKPVDLKHAEKMIGYLKDAGIYTSANFIIGFPTETWDEIRQTLKYAEYIDVDYVKISPLIPLKHTRLADATTEYAKSLPILRAYEWDRINFTDSKKRKRTADRMGITEEELNVIRKKTLENITF